MAYETKYFSHDAAGNKDFWFATHSTWEVFQKTLKEKWVAGQNYYEDKLRQTSP